jgi:hypothetical protein
MKKYNWGGDKSPCILNLCITELAAVAKTLCTREMLNSNLSGDIGYLDSGSSRFSSVPVSKCQDSTLIGTRLLFPNPLQFYSHQLSYHSTLYNVIYRQFRKINHIQKTSGIKRPGREAGHTPPCSAKIKKGEAITVVPHMSSCHSA